MKHFRIKTFEELQFGEDIVRIGRVLRENGYYSTPEQCTHLWQMYSESMCASWLGLPDEDQALFSCVKNYMIDE